MIAVKLTEVITEIERFKGYLDEDMILRIKIAISRLPTIDAEPIRHGKLMRTEAYPHRLYCSECFKTLIRNEEICFEKNEFPKYCMWCGAKMDEEENEL